MSPDICLVSGHRDCPCVDRHLLRHFLGARSHARLFTFVVAPSPLYGPGLGQRGEVWSCMWREERQTAKSRHPLFPPQLGGSSGGLGPHFLHSEREISPPTSFIAQLLAREGPGGVTAGVGSVPWPNTTALVRIAVRASLSGEMVPVSLSGSTVC